jgi:hypothetical protein
MASATLSGCPSVTDSDVKKYLSMKSLLNPFGPILLCRLNWDLREVKQIGGLRGCHKTGGNGYPFYKIVDIKLTLI